MSPDQVLIELAKDRTTHSLEALGSAEAHRGVLVQPLLEVLDRCVTHPDTASEEEAQLLVDAGRARILAAVCDRDLEPIKRLVLNRDADECSRRVAVTALALLAVWAEVPRDTILDDFAWLACEGLERQTNYVWGALAAESADIEAIAVFPDRRAYDQGFIDPQVIRRSELDEVEVSPRGALLEHMKNRHPRLTMSPRPQRGGSVRNPCL